MPGKERARNALGMMSRRNDLTAIEVEYLHEVARVGMSQKTLPAKVRARLIEFGYIEQKRGDFLTTSKGKLYAASHKT